tara:strand:- start:4640 stop:5053 length:414 start_codon:yes stop_codon:yes gene_type:complete
MPADIDMLKPTRSLIDLDSHSEGDFGLDDFKLNFIFDDILLVEYVDETASGDILRNGIVVPVNAVNKAWRKGKVILAGPNSKYVKQGDIVLFPNNVGVTVANINVDNVGKVKSGLFLNEDRMFGICTPNDDNTATSS